MGLTSQVLQRDAMRALVDQRVKVRRLGVLDGIEQRQPSRLDSYREGQELPSVLLWRLDADIAQPTGGLSQQRPDRFAHACVPPTCDNLCCVSASCSALITASRSPLRT